MVLVILLAGLIIGWLINWFSTIAPRFAAEPAPAHMEGGPEAISALWFLASSAFPHSHARALPRWLWLHLGVELITVLSAGLLWTRFGLAVDALAAIVLLIFLVLIAVIDLKHRLVLNLLTYPAIALALILNLLVLRQDPRNILLGGGMSFGIFALAAMLRPGEIGGGDVKLALLIGVMFGFPRMLWALLVGGGAGALAAIILLTRQRKQSAQMFIPYAPFLCLGAVVAILYNPFMR